MLPGTAPSLLTWHLHPGCEHGTSETLETESPLAWLQIMKIMAFHFQSFLESQFASEPVPLFGLGYLDLLYWKRMALPAKSEKRRQGRKGVEKGIKLVLSMKNVQWMPTNPSPFNQVILVSTQEADFCSPLSSHTGKWHISPALRWGRNENEKYFLLKRQSSWLYPLGCLENKANSTFLFTDSPEMNSVLRFHYHFYCLSSQARLILSLFLIKEMEQPH